MSGGGRGGRRKCELCGQRPRAMNLLSNTGGISKAYLLFLLFLELQAESVLVLVLVWYYIHLWRSPIFGVACAYIAIMKRTTRKRENDGIEDW